MKSPLLFIKPCLLMMIVTLLLATAGGLGIIHMRQSITASAQVLRTVELKVAAAEREVREMDAQIARLHRPAYLIRRAGRMGLDLQPPQPWQLVRLPTEYATEPLGQDFLAQYELANERDWDINTPRREP